MTAVSKGNDDVIAKLTPGVDLGLAHLSDDELLANTRRLVGKTNQVLAALLAHLAEVEARGVHRTRRCASLYTYCIYELRFSEDAAARRSAAARLVKQFPPLFDAIAHGELHLTGLLMIASTREANGVARPVTSSFITCSHSQSAALALRQTSRCAVPRTTRWLPKKTSGRSSCVSDARRRNMNGSQHSNS